MFIANVSFPRVEKHLLIWSARLCLPVSDGTICQPVGRDGDGDRLVAEEVPQVCVITPQAGRGPVDRSLADQDRTVVPDIVTIELKYLNTYIKYNIQ